MLRRGDDLGERLLSPARLLIMINPQEERHKTGGLPGVGNAIQPNCLSIDVFGQAFEN